MGQSDIKPSLFNRRISVVRAATLADDAGGTDNTGYTTLFTSWASWIEMSTARKAYYGLDLYNIFAEVVIRWSADRPFDTSNLILYQNQYWSVNDAKIELQAYKRYWRLIVEIASVN